MIIVPGNVVVKSPYELMQDVYEQTFTNTLIVEEGRVTKGNFDNQFPITIYTGRDVTFRFKFVLVDSVGTHSPYSLAEIDMVQIALKEREGYSTVVVVPEEDEEIPEPIVWELIPEVPKSLGFASYELDPETDIPAKGTYWAEVQMVKGSRTYTFSRFTLIVQTL